MYPPSSASCSALPRSIVFGIAPETVQRDDERILLVLAHLRRNKNRIRKFLVGVLEQIRSLFNARIDSGALTAASRATLTGGRAGLRGRLLRPKLNLR